MAGPRPRARAFPLDWPPAERPTLPGMDAALTPSLPSLSSVQAAAVRPARATAPKASLAPASPRAPPPRAPHHRAPRRVPGSPAAPHPNLPPASGASAGYWNVTLIPEGARHIRVAQRSRNLLGTAGARRRWARGGGGRE